MIIFESAFKLIECSYGDFRCPTCLIHPSVNELQLARSRHRRLNCHVASLLIIGVEHIISTFRQPVLHQTIHIMAWHVIIKQESQ